MLPGAGLGDQPPFAHTPGQQRLANSIVDLVRAGVAQVFPLQVDLRPAEPPRQVLGKRERRRPADVVMEQSVQFTAKVQVVPTAAVDRLQLDQRRHQGLGHVTPPIGAKMTVTVRQPWHW